MNEELFAHLRELLSNKKFRELKEKLLDMNEIDIAEFINDLEEDNNLIVIFRMLSKEASSEIFANLDIDKQEYIVKCITDREIASIIEELFIDDAVDFLEEVPANVVQRVLKNAKSETRSLINQFLQYKDDSAGSIMTAEFVHIKQDMTVKEAIDHIRKTGYDKETVYTCYVTNNKRILEGIVSIKDLLLARDNEVVKNIMNVDYIFSYTNDDQEEVAKLFAKYDLLALPVLDQEKRLVGIVTIDDVVDIIKEEATEDFEKMAGMTPSEKEYLKSNVWSLAKNRIIWLLFLMLSATLTGSILSSFEEALNVLPILIVFIPMLMDTGGNAGAQASTMIIRGMAVNEIYPKDILRVLWKEVRVALICGTILCIVNFARIMIMYSSKERIMDVSLVISLSLLMTVIVAKSIGCTLPIIAKKIKLDPAIMASPIITTLVDSCSLLIFFFLARTILHI